MKIICKLFGHKIVGLNTKRCFASCSRCHKGLKVSYDMAYGQDLVIGDYGNQKTFCWCDCGNELCSTSFLDDTDVVRYKCSKCGLITRWNFDAPIPFKIKD